MSMHPELVADAERVLTEAGCPFEQVVSVDGDAILYENKCHRARTLWLHRPPGSGRLKARMVEGFPAEPPDGWPDASTG